MPIAHTPDSGPVALVAKLLLPVLLVCQTPQNAVAQTTVDTQTVVEYEGARVRINLSGQMRHISEEVAAATCSLKAGFDPEVSKLRLATARASFDTNFAALSHGNPRLGIPSRETASRVKSSLTKLLKIWASTSVSTMHILQGREVERYAEIVASNTELQEHATQLTADEFIAEYVNPAEIFAADALTVSLAGRQLKLIRKMEKIACAILSESRSFGDLDAYAKTSDSFTKTLAAMQTGMENAGVIAPPNKAVSAKLSDISEILQSFQPTQKKLRQVNSNPQEVWTDVRELSDRLFAASEQLVSLYLLTAPGNEEAFKTAVLSFANEELVSWRDDTAMQDINKASGFLDVQLSQSKGLILSAAVIDATGRLVASSSDWRSESSGVLNLPVLEEIAIGDAEFDEATGGYYCEVMIPTATEAVGQYLVVKLDLLRFL